eukprot:CAMPEP_0114675408 /NCGR_PEP_ID=MMETSP0191-20121206/47837_1 /TAXON_ID=126664 /ORGANISM="Sorites sp." /LENGTH=51 /DNA_ID=CAMNT_0001944639 /DNA_START=8 /DNA_END=159 /DNA_ORIENTATION=-
MASRLHAAETRAESLWAELSKLSAEPKYVLGVRKWIWASFFGFLATMGFVA